MRAELKTKNGRFVIEVDGEVLIDVLHRNNLVKNFKSNKKIKELGITDLFENNIKIFPREKGNKLVKEKSQPVFTSKYKNFLNFLMTKEEFSHKDMLNGLGLKRPDTALLKDLEVMSNYFEKINLGVGKGIIYKVIK